jgi:hypothetical protein
MSFRGAARSGCSKTSPEAEMGEPRSTSSCSSMFQRAQRAAGIAEQVVQRSPRLRISSVTSSGFHLRVGLDCRRYSHTTLPGGSVDDLGGKQISHRIDCRPRMVPRKERLFHALAQPQVHAARLVPGYQRVLATGTG